MTNIVSGKLHTHNHGELVVLNWRTGAKAVLKFHENGYFSKDEDRKVDTARDLHTPISIQVTGSVRNAEGHVKFLMEASWDHQAKLVHLDKDGQPRHEETLWTANTLSYVSHLLRIPHQ